MQKIILLACLCLTIATSAFGEAKKNLVLHRPYTYWPTPAYGDCTDEGDIKQLTDGFTKYTGGMWMFPSTVGWSAGLDVPVVMLFDLGKEATLSELCFNSAGGGGAGVVEIGFRVLVSLDDKSYVSAGEHVAPPPPPDDQQDRIGIQLRVSLEGVRARYVAVVAKAPVPFPFVFVDEVEIYGKIPADSKSVFPIQSAIHASGARGLQEMLAGGKRAENLLDSLLSPIERQIDCWPAEQARIQREELNEYRNRVVAEAADFGKLRAEITSRHSDLAREVYESEMLVWEVLPDDTFSMLSLPETLNPPRSASIHTVINALEATALGVANLNDTAEPLSLSFAGGGEGAPQITARIGWFFETTNARYVPDALLAIDSAQTIPPGESKLVWLLAESTGAKPGIYQYELTVRLGDESRVIPIAVHVHNVVLSTNTPLSTGNWSDLNTGDRPVLPEVRDTMLKYRMTVGMGTGGSYSFPRKDDKGEVILPMELDFTDMDKFLEFHKDFDEVGWFIPFDYHSDRPHYDWFGPTKWMSPDFKTIFSEWIVQLSEHIKSKGRNYDEFFFQVFDETLDDKVSEICELVHAADPKVRVMCTIPQASRSATERMIKGGVNIYNYHATRLGYDGEPDGFPLMREKGRELWIYGAADAAFGGGKERDPLGFYRYLNWTAFHHGATGVYFWNMLWNNGRSPVWGPETVDQNYWPLVYPIGEGFPVPPADFITAETVIPSRRLEYVRMGIEDYMLLKMADERIDRLGTAGVVDRRQLNDIIKVVIVNRDNDRRLFREKRRELVELVEKLGEKAID